jgi:hypothetical protein
MSSKINLPDNPFKNNYLITKRYWILSKFKFLSDMALKKKNNSKTAKPFNVRFCTFTYQCRFFFVISRMMYWFFVITKTVTVYKNKSDTIRLMMIKKKPSFPTSISSRSSISGLSTKRLTSTLNEIPNLPTIFKSRPDLNRKVYAYNKGSA